MPTVSVTVKVSLVSGICDNGTKLSLYATCGSAVIAIPVITVTNERKPSANVSGLKLNPLMLNTTSLIDDCDAMLPPPGCWKLRCVFFSSLIAKRKRISVAERDHTACCALFTDVDFTTTLKRAVTMSITHGPPLL